MPFPPIVKEDALVACGRHCCICHKFCGIKMEVHHIREESDGGDNTTDNAIPLCFDCHADMRSYDHKHPKGNKYTERELKRHRDNWCAKVAGNIGIANRQEVIETDKEIYQLLCDLLPWNGGISFIRNKNFAGWSFPLSQLDDLHRFEHQCANPTFEFLDPDLEGQRCELAVLIERFTMTISVETFPTATAGVNAVPEEWEFDQPERFERVVNELHRTAQAIVTAYDTLTKTATRKLGVLPVQVASPASGSEPGLELQWNGVTYWRSKADGTKDGPFCQVCYDSTKQLCRLHDGDSTSSRWEVIDRYVCKVCDNVFEDCQDIPPDLPDDVNKPDDDIPF
ncbi:MAG: HNH endonuclease [Planctomycetales bacterium]|nr:HNH endonuclease [Planctomycetales bacterium]